MIIGFDWLQKFNPKIDWPTLDVKFQVNKAELGDTKDRWRTIEKKIYLSCDVCQKSKNLNVKPAGELQPLHVPNYPWEEVSMDFITHLPKSKGYDSILVVVDRLSKMAHFLPLYSTSSASDVAKIFFDNIFRLHGLPKRIVSDRDSKFTSSFWKKLCQLVNIKMALSTAFHPQTDGQTERTVFS